MSSIAARNITMVFGTRGGEVRALDDVTVEVPDGHFACIVGASGCGKSTLLNIMAGLVRPTSPAMMFSSVDLPQTRTMQAVPSPAPRRSRRRARAPRRRGSRTPS